MHSTAMGSSRSSLSGANFMVLFVYGYKFSSTATNVFCSYQIFTDNFGGKSGIYFY